MKRAITSQKARRIDSEEIPQMLGRNTAQLKRFLGEEYAHPLVHRDNLVLV
mgnify:FL=1